MYRLQLGHGWNREMSQDFTSIRGIPLLKRTFNEKYLAVDSKLNKSFRNKSQTLAKPNIYKILKCTYSEPNTHFEFLAQT